MRALFGEHDLEPGPLVDEDAFDLAPEQLPVDLFEPVLLERAHFRTLTNWGNSSSTSH